MDTIFYIAILVMSVVIHEVSHGFAAEYFGDKTARYAGRLTLNPIKHLDLFGSIILPGLLVLTNAPFLFGWAKPVPYNPDNLSNKRWGEVGVASAGILANLFIAVFFGLLLRLTLSFEFPAGFYSIASTIVVTNLILAVFSLIPIPPLDGSKILFSLLPASFSNILYTIEQYSIFILIPVVFYFGKIFVPLLEYLYSLLTGLAI